MSPPLRAGEAFIKSRKTVRAVVLSPGNDFPFRSIAPAWLLAGVAACAQSPNNLVGGSQLNPPPPPPKIEVSVVPRMDVPSRPSDQAPPRTSFHKRVCRCLK